ETKPEPKVVGSRTDGPFSDDKRGVKVGGSAWYTDVVGDTLVVGGVIAVAVGGVMYSGARPDLDDAEKAPNGDQYPAKVDDAHSKRTYAVVLFGGGGVLATAGIVHYIVHKKAPASGVGMAPAPGGGVLTYAARF